MLRRISSFDQDERGDWRAWLDCYHPQHVRHQPPFTNRPWVMTQEGRQEKLGLELNCVRCDNFELPTGLTPYKQTPTFSELTIPKGLQRDHSTKTGTWGLIHVETGTLVYRTPDTTFELNPEKTGIVVPNMLHSVASIGHVLFYVEFLHQDN